MRVDLKRCRKEQGKAEPGNSCLQTPGTCESCPNWERNRLLVYDKLRDMHRILKEIPERTNEWEQNALDAVRSTLYLAEHVFTCPAEEYFDILKGEQCRKQKSPRRRKQR